MPLITFVLYLVVELAALVWLASTVGILWTVVTVLGLSVLGLIAIGQPDPEDRCLGAIGARPPWWRLP